MVVMTKKPNNPNMPKMPNLFGCFGSFGRFGSFDTGQAYIELVMVLPLFLIVIAALILFGRVLYVKIVLDMASYDACRAAVEALRHGDGIAQGMIAGQETLRGFYLNPAGANITISPAGGWTRGTPVRCVAAYDLFVGDIPALSSIASGSGVPLQSTTWSRVELWRSDWR
jgi:Flp pilus assembly protein TadG